MHEHGSDIRNQCGCMTVTHADVFSACITMSCCFPKWYNFGVDNVVHPEPRGPPLTQLTGETIETELRHLKYDTHCVECTNLSEEDVEEYKNNFKEQFKTYLRLRYRTDNYDEFSDTITEYFGALTSIPGIAASVSNHWHCHQMRSNSVMAPYRIHSIGSV